MSAGSLPHVLDVRRRRQASWRLGFQPDDVEAGTGPGSLVPTRSRLGVERAYEVGARLRERVRDPQVPHHASSATRRHSKSSPCSHACRTSTRSTDIVSPAQRLSWRGGSPQASTRLTTLDRSWRTKVALGPITSFGRPRPTGMTLRQEAHVTSANTA